MNVIYMIKYYIQNSSSDTTLLYNVSDRCMKRGITCCNNTIKICEYTRVYMLTSSDGLKTAGGGHT